MSEMNIIKSGTYFLITTGAYSDYSVSALYCAKRDADTESLLKEYLELYPEQKEDYEFKPHRYMKWLLVDKDIADEIPFAEYHLGDYSSIADIDLLLPHKEA